MQTFFFLNKRRYLFAFVNKYSLRVTMQISRCSTNISQLTSHLHTTPITVRVGWEHRCLLPLYPKGWCQNGKFHRQGPPTYKEINTLPWQLQVLSIFKMG